MKTVIDTNIIFSMLILKNSRLRDAFFEKKVNWYAPNFVLVEIFKRKEKLLKYSHLTDSEMYELLYQIFQKIKFINEQIISRRNKAKAYELCREIDEHDTPIVALALELNASIWTGDKKLKDGLIHRGFDNFFVPL